MRDANTVAIVFTTIAMHDEATRALLTDIGSVTNKMSDSELQEYWRRAREIVDYAIMHESD